MLTDAATSRRHSTSASGSARFWIVLVDRIGVHPRAHVAAVVAAALVEHDQLVRRLDRQLAQQDLVDQREDRRIGADAERQRQDRHDGKQGAAAEAAQGEAQITQDGIHGLDLTVRGGRWLLRVLGFSGSRVLGFAGSRVPGFPGSRCGSAGSGPLGSYGSLSYNNFRPRSRNLCTSHDRASKTLGTSRWHSWCSLGAHGISQAVRGSRLLQACRRDTKGSNPAHAALICPAGFQVHHSDS